MFIMSDKETAAVVQGIYDSFMAGDIAAVIGSLSDNVEWVLPEIPKVPFSGKRQGKDSLTAFFSTMADHQEVRSFNVHGMVVQGNRVVAYGHYEWHVKTTGRGWEGDFSHHWTGEDGKISRLQEYSDTAAATVAF